MQLQHVHIINSGNAAFLKGKTWIIYHTQRQAAFENTGAITSIHLQYQKLVRDAEKEVIAIKFQLMFPKYFP